MSKCDFVVISKDNKSTIKDKQGVTLAFESRKEAANYISSSRLKRCVIGLRKKD